MRNKIKNGANLKTLVYADKNVKLLVGVGLENLNIDRRLHAKILNKDVFKKFRAENCINLGVFSSFNKDIRVSVNEI